MAKIFISYRRDDAKADARDLQNRLRQAFGRSMVFMDVDNLKAGQRFDQELARALDQCDVLLAVIGSRWLHLFRERQAGRGDDYVRDEIAAALARDAIVIPVLVEDAELPAREDLPPELRKLLLHQAHQITHKRFGRDVSDLVEAIRKSRRARRGKAAPASAFGTWPTTSVRLAVTALAVAGLAAALTLARWNSAERSPVSDSRSASSFRDCATVCPDLVVVPAGTFTMGSPVGEDNERPSRHVVVERAFAVGRFEVTFAEWDACVAASGCERAPEVDWERERRPVVSVSWKDAKAYVAWLSAKTGKDYRLLTEAEWEYAVRARTTSAFAFGDNLAPQDAQNQETSGASMLAGPARVGSFKPNAFDLYDMHGNAAEWVEDCFYEHYMQAPSDVRARVEPHCARRVVRGGSWRDAAHDLRSSSRRGVRAEDRYNFIGFRVARTL